MTSSDGDVGRRRASSPCVAWRVAASLCLAAACAPGLTRELGESDGVCTRLLTPALGVEAVVSIATGPIEVTSEPGPPVLLWQWCSGVAIAPRLVLTAKHCVTDRMLQDGVCDRSGNPLPSANEGAVRYGAARPPATVSVFVGERRGGVIVAQGTTIIATETRSRCRDDLAAVLLDRELPISVSVPVRLDPVSVVGESLVLSSFEDVERSERVVQALQLTRAEATGSLPPRSLLVPSTCDTASGGALIASATGALVGLVAARTRRSCEDPESRTIAVHVPDHAELLRQAAELGGTWLQAEQHPRPYLRRVECAEDQLVVGEEDAGAGTVGSSDQ